MSIKKLLILSAAGLAAVTSAAAFAGGPDDMGPQSLFAPAIYVDVHGGWSFYNWNQVVGANTGTIFAMQQGMTNSQGGAIGGLDVGFQIFKNIAVEVGGMYLPRVQGYANGANDVTTPACQTATTSTSSSCQQTTQYNWAAYAAGRFNVHMPYVEGLDLFAKVGGVWRAMSNQNLAVRGKAGLRSYWDVIYGAGLSYDIMHSGFNVGVQWMHIPGHNAGTNNGSAGEDDAANHRKLASDQPNQNLLTGSVGYKFDF
jgi:hypothetical protein